MATLEMVLGSYDANAFEPALHPSKQVSSLFHHKNAASRGFINSFALGSY
jgi:hypothetical protein